MLHHLQSALHLQNKRAAMYKWAIGIFVNRITGVLDKERVISVTAILEVKLCSPCGVFITLLNQNICYLSKIFECDIWVRILISQLVQCVLDLFSRMSACRFMTMSTHPAPLCAFQPSVRNSLSSEPITRQLAIVCLPKITHSWAVHNFIFAITLFVFSS